MLVRAEWWREGTQFRCPYPEGYHKEVEVPDDIDFETLKNFAIEDSKPGHYLRRLEKKVGRYWKDIKEQK